MSDAAERFTGRVINSYGSGVGIILEDVTKRHLKFLSSEYRVGSRVSYQAVAGAIEWLATDLRPYVHEVKA